jgi:hypothetical protein
MLRPCENPSSQAGQRIRAVGLRGVCACASHGSMPPAQPLPCCLSPPCPLIQLSEMLVSGELVAQVVGVRGGEVGRAPLAGRAPRYGRTGLA